MGKDGRRRMEMKRLMFRIPATLLLSGLFATTTSAQEIAANLRVQLSEVEIQKSELQARGEQIQEDLKPENIERSLAGIGSTRPELLRERRQRQLEVAKARVRLQLDDLDRIQTRLETAIAEADAEAYWESAGIVIRNPSDLP
jgi:hypothetical protein